MSKWCESGNRFNFKNDLELHNHIGNICRTRLSVNLVWNWKMFYQGPSFRVAQRTIIRRVRNRRRSGTHLIEAKEMVKRARKDFMAQIKVSESNRKIKKDKVSNFLSTNTCEVVAQTGTELCGTGRCRRFPRPQPPLVIFYFIICDPAAETGDSSIIVPCSSHKLGDD